MIKKYIDFLNEKVKYTHDDLQLFVNKYKTISEFRKNMKNEYNYAVLHGLIGNLFKNHQNLGYSKKPDGYWTDENLQIEANKYKTRTEFQKKSSGAYDKALTKKLIDTLFKNHPNLGYSDKEEWKENSYVIYSYEILDFNKVYVGLSNNVDRRDKEHQINEKEKLTIFCKENKIEYPKYKILEDNLKSDEAKLKEKYWVDFYKNNNWELFNIAKPGSLGGTDVKWTMNKLQEEVNKYKTRTEFKNNAGGAYKKVRELSKKFDKILMDELFKNHPNLGYSTKQKPSGWWTEERIREESSKYNTIKEFAKNSGGAYDAAKDQ